MKISQTLKHRILFSAWTCTFHIVFCRSKSLLCKNMICATASTISSQCSHTSQFSELNFASYSLKAPKTSQISSIHTEFIFIFLNLEKPKNCWQGNASQHIHLANLLCFFNEGALLLARTLAREMPALCGKSVHSFIIRTLEKHHLKFLQLFSGELQLYR